MVPRTPERLTSRIANASVPAYWGTPGASFGDPLPKGTGRSAWNNAPEGSASNSKACPTCNRDVFGNPNTGELRNTPLGWDVDHVRKWEEIRRELQARGATAAEYRKAYNDLDNTILRCRTCNRADNQVGP